MERERSKGRRIALTLSTTYCRSTSTLRKQTHTLLTMHVESNNPIYRRQRQLSQKSTKEEGDGEQTQKWEQAERSNHTVVGYFQLNVLSQVLLFGV